MQLEYVLTIYILHLVILYLYQMLTRQNNKIVTLFFANKTKHNLEKGGDGARAVHVIYETSNFF